MIHLKSPKEIEIMLGGAKIAFAIHQRLSEKIRPGITTLELERMAEDLMSASHARSAYRGYRGYPSSLITDVNDCVMHGSPSSCRLKEGDLITVHVGVIYDGYYANKAVCYAVGDLDSKANRLLEATNEALWSGISACQVGHELGEISRVIQRTAESAGLGVVREFCGHGIGRSNHEEPPVLNYVDRQSGGHHHLRLKPGLVLKIHPIFTAGSEGVRVLEDGWTVMTKDGQYGSNASETVAVTPDGPMVLTGLGAYRISESPDWSFGLHELSIGNRIAGERIEDVKRGGMGIVYLTARHAFKTLIPDFMGPPHLFASEVNTWIRLPRHENIVTAYTILPQEGLVYLVLERIYGDTLRDRIQSNTCTMENIVNWAKQICRGMDFADSMRRLVHRDLKPDNILIDGDKARITDFGLATTFLEASSLKSHGGRREFNTKHFSIMGETCGTPAYMAPEQWNADSGRRLDNRTDIYSFGCLLYECLTGSPPFLGSNASTLKFQHLHAEPARPSALARGIPETLDQIVLRCLKKDANHRYQSFARILQDLEPMRVSKERMVRHNIEHSIREGSPSTEASFTPPAQRVGLVLRARAIEAVRSILRIPSRVFESSGARTRIRKNRNQKPENL